MATLHTPEELVRTTQRPPRAVTECTSSKLIMNLHFIQTSVPDNGREVQRYGAYSLTETDIIERLNIKDLAQGDIGRTVVLRCRLSSARRLPKLIFLNVRQGMESIQVSCAIRNGGPSPEMIKWIDSLPAESILLVQGTLRSMNRPKKIHTLTVQDMEIEAEKVHLISSPVAKLPFDLADASRPESLSEEHTHNRVLFNNLLNGRVLHLRTPTNQAIFTIQAAVEDILCTHFRRNKFLRIHTPKLQGAATESGASVFKLEYFKGAAYLAQSPQLHKQMCIAADFERVYEVGPVFRAENSLTHRHLTEFTGIDIEMVVEHHYHEVMRTLDEALKRVFRGMREGYGMEIEKVGEQFSVAEFQWREGDEGTLIITFAEAVEMLVEDGVEREKLEDINTANERRLGSIVKQKHGVDYFIVDKFPLRLRPFYTMPDVEDSTLSNAFDFFMRGEEILSGGQRIHEPALLIKRMELLGIDPDTMKTYIDAFKIGCPPHGGGGVGLERVVMLYLGIGDIRRASLFERPQEIIALGKSSAHNSPKDGLIVCL